MKTVVIEVTKNGETKRRLSLNWESELFDVDQSVRIIGEGGVTIASKKAGKNKFTPAG